MTTIPNAKEKANELNEKESIHKISVHVKKDMKCVELHSMKLHYVPYGDGLRAHVIGYTALLTVDADGKFTLAQNPLPKQHIDGEWFKEDYVNPNAAYPYITD